MPRDAIALHLPVLTLGQCVKQSYQGFKVNSKHAPPVENRFILHFVFECEGRKGYSLRAFSVS